MWEGVDEVVVVLNGVLVPEAAGEEVRLVEWSGM